MKKNLIAPLSILFIAITVLVAGAGIYVAHANPSFFINTSTSAATSTVSQIVPGVATTTLTFNTSGLGRTYAADTATLLLQVTASSTSSRVNVDYQYSNNGIDWYADNLTLSTATTTTEIASTTAITFRLPSTATTTRALTMPTPTQYTRAIISAVGANSFIYASVVAKQEAN